MKWLWRKIKNFFRKKKPTPPIIINDEVENETRPNDNEDTDKPDDLGIDETVYTEGAKELVYPKAVYYGEKMRTRGRYKKGYPQGAIIHYTAGRSRNKVEGGSRHKDTNKEMGKKSTDSAIRNNSLCYFVNDRDGNIHQAFKLNRWGYHAGTSKWPKLWGSVSDELVGIETQGAGKLSEVHEGIYKAYFTDTNKGDLPFYEDEVRHITTTKDNLTRGTFHKFTEAQEKGLVELLLWLKRNNPEVFNFDLVLGHDEVAGKEMLGYQRKVDPSGSLSMTMPEFREYLKKEYKNRYGES